MSKKNKSKNAGDKKKGKRLTAEDLKKVKGGIGNVAATFWWTKQATPGSTVVRNISPAVSNISIKGIKSR